MTYMIHKRIVRYGEYATKKDREARSNDLRGTHFRLGSDPDNGITSYVYDYRRFGLDTARGDKDGPFISARELAKKDFKLGSDKVDPMSSYKYDYPPKYGGAGGLNKELLKDLRATHYALGSDPNSFQTIHKQDYVDQGLGRKDPVDNLRKMMDRQNFRLGDDPLNYQTSAADAFKRPPPCAGPTYCF